MKRLFLLLVISMSFASVKAQYGYYQPTDAFMQYEDLGPYGYQNLISRIQRYGRRIDQSTTSIYENRIMNLAGYRLNVTQAGNLRYVYGGTIMWYDYYVNGFWIGRAQIVGRSVEATFYRSRIHIAVNSRIY